MNMRDIHENARRCIELHGNKAEIIARQKVEENQERGDEIEAQNWSRIRKAIMELRPAHNS